ncbi:MAG: VOC family protein [Planctomycetota bacterium]
MRANLVLPVADFKRDRAWYENTLGFRTVYLNTDAGDPDGNYAILQRDTARIHLMLDDQPRGRPGSNSRTGAPARLRCTTRPATASSWPKPSTAEPTDNPLRPPTPPRAPARSGCGRLPSPRTARRRRG